jgi:hypothetical protein
MGARELEAALARREVFAAREDAREARGLRAREDGVEVARES